ncbi:MAG: hypothetical protein QOI80_3501 [Solirubrobacteraceae bacterium]|nr:hypothetical protein [Solirubrobacteraceae bacterium]
MSALDEFDRLDALPEDGLLGEWDGELLPTGHPGEQLLDRLRWVGKRFVSRDEVYPLICLSESGEREVNPVMGEATVRMVEYRGVVTATMVYDKHPIFDSFRAVDADTVMGAMDRKGDAAPLMFVLRRRSAPA